MISDLKTPPQIIVCSDRQSLARDAAERFVACAHDAIASQDRFSVALSGGSTPRDLFALLATPEFATQIDWARIHVFWGDERAVPSDHPDSNFKMANDVLLARVAIPAQNIHRIRTELSAQDAVSEYEIEIGKYFSVDGNKGTEGTEGKSFPMFDLILLGLGANGHTASLFPHTKLLDEKTRWVAAEYIGEVKMERITLIAPVINAAKNILWLVAGADKAVTVREVLRGDYRPQDLPAQLIQSANATWLLDKNAASEIAAS